MPIHLTFDDASKLGISTYRGEIQTTDLQEYLLAWSHSKYMDYNELVTIHEVQTEFSELLKHSNQLRGIDLHFLPGRKSAIVVAHPSAQPFAEFWKTAYETGVAGEREIKIFTAENDARTWAIQR
jgi:hypothetical protein